MDYAKLRLRAGVRAQGRTLHANMYLYLHVSLCVTLMLSEHVLMYFYL